MAIERLTKVQELEIKVKSMPAQIASPAAPRTGGDNNLSVRSFRS